MCAKMAKDTQTDYTRGGKRISDTSIPVYTNAIDLVGQFQKNPTARLDEYLDKYYSNTATQNDFDRMYQRSMANATGQNYSATTGGYTSSGQRAYDDQQRYMNDLYARLREQGIQSAYNMGQQDYANLLNSFGPLQTAYQNGQAYSDIERYNNMVDQNNSFMNQLGGITGGVGKIFSAIPTPMTQAIGAGLQVGGNMVSTDVSGLASRLGAGSAQQAGSVGNIGDAFTNIGQGIAATANSGNSPFLNRLFGGNQVLTDKQVEERNAQLAKNNLAGLRGYTK